MQSMPTMRCPPWAIPPVMGAGLAAHLCPEPTAFRPLHLSPSQSLSPIAGCFIWQQQVPSVNHRVTASQVRKTTSILTQQRLLHSAFHSIISMPP